MESHWHSISLGAEEERPLSQWSEITISRPFCLTTPSGSQLIFEHFGKKETTQYWHWPKKAKTLLARLLVWSGGSD